MTANALSSKVAATYQRLPWTYICRHCNLFHNATFKFSLWQEFTEQYMNPLAKRYLKKIKKIYWYNSRIGFSERPQLYYSASWKDSSLHMLLKISQAAQIRMPREKQKQKQRKEKNLSLFFASFSLSLFF